MICKGSLFTTSSKNRIFDKNTVVDKNFIINPSELHEKIVQGTSNFVGVDGFCFDKSDENENIYELRLFQIKTVRLDVIHPWTELDRIFNKTKTGLENIVSRAKENLLEGQSNIVKEMLFVTSKIINEADKSKILSPEYFSYDGITIIDQEDFLRYLQAYDPSLVNTLRVWKSRIN